MASTVASENEFCKNPTSKDTITTIDSESYDSIGGHKHSLEQDTGWTSTEAKRRLEDKIKTALNRKQVMIDLRAMNQLEDRICHGTT